MRVAARDGLQRALVRLHGHLRLRDARQGEEVQLDAERPLVARLGDQPAVDLVAHGVVVEEELYALVLHPPLPGIGGGGLGRQPAGFDQDACGVDPPHAQQVVLHRLGPGLGELQVVLLHAGFGGAAHQGQLGVGGVAHGFAGEVQDVEAAAQEPGHLFGSEGVRVGARLVERVGVRQVAAAGREEHHLGGRPPGRGHGDVEGQRLGFERDRVDHLVGDDVLVQDRALELLEDGHELGRRPGLPGAAAVAPGEAGEELVHPFAGHVVDAVGPELADAGGLGRHLGLGELAVQVLPVRKDHQHFLLPGRHPLHDVQAGDDPLVKIGLVGEPAVERLGEKRLPLRGVRRGERAHVQQALAHQARLAVAEDDGVNVVDRADALEQLFERVQQRLDRLAFRHGEGVVDHQHHVDGHGLAGLQRLDREDPPLADAPGDREVLDLQVADRLARGVDHRNDGLLGGARGVHGDLRGQRGGLDPDVLDRCGRGGQGNPEDGGQHPPTRLRHGHSPARWCVLRKPGMTGAATGLNAPPRAGRRLSPGDHGHISRFFRDYPQAPCMSICRGGAKVRPHRRRYHQLSQGLAREAHPRDGQEVRTVPVGKSRVGELPVPWCRLQEHSDRNCL